MHGIHCLKYRLFLALMVIGIHIAAVFGIELQMKTENVIKGEPIILFCHIPNFTNIASFHMPNGLPFRRVFCNNRDGCAINKHKLFNVNSNSSGLTLTLKALNERIEGEYACTYKGEKKTYSLNISTLNIIDPNNGCNITKIDVKYECQTKCIMLKNDKVIHWKFKTDGNETFTWNTSVSHNNYDCCKDKQQYKSHRNISDLDGMLICFITVSTNVTLWSPPIRVTSVADADQPKEIIIIPSLFTLLVAIVVSISFIYIRYKRSKKTKEPHTGSKVKCNSIKDTFTVILTQRDQFNSNEDDPMVKVEERIQKP